MYHIKYIDSFVLTEIACLPVSQITIAGEEILNYYKVSNTELSVCVDISSH